MSVKNKKELSYKERLLIEKRVSEMEFFYEKCGMFPPDLKMSIYDTAMNISSLENQYFLELLKNSTILYGVSREPILEALYECHEAIHPSCEENEVSKKEPECAEDKKQRIQEYENLLKGFFDL